MNELEFRILIAGFLNNTYKESELLNIAEIKKCDICDHYDLEEYMHEYETDIDKIQYCDTCWEAK